MYLLQRILPVRAINLPYFNEALHLEMIYNNKKVFVSVIYRSPSQNNDEFVSFLFNFEKIIVDIKNRKLYLSVITGDFNARSSSWWSNGINATEGAKLFAKIFQELGLESLKSRRWFRRLCCMFKTMKNEAPNYLISLIPKREQTINTRNKHLPTYNYRTDVLSIPFFLVL